MNKPRIWTNPKVSVWALLASLAPQTQLIKSKKYEQRQTSSQQYIKNYCVVIHYYPPFPHNSSPPPYPTFPTSDIFAQFKRHFQTGVLRLARSAIETNPKYQQTPNWKLLCWNNRVLKFRMVKLCVQFSNVNIYLRYLDVLHFYGHPTTPNFLNEFYL